MLGAGNTLNEQSMIYKYVDETAQHLIQIEDNSLIQKKRVKKCKNKRKHIIIACIIYGIIVIFIIFLALFVIINFV